MRVCVCVWPLHEQIQQLLRFTERPVRGEKRSDEIGIWKTRENVFFNYVCQTISVHPANQPEPQQLHTHYNPTHYTQIHTLNVNNSHGRLSDWPCGVGTDSGSSLMDLFCSADGNNRNSESKSKQSAGIILARKQTRGSDARHTHTHTHTPKIDSGPADCDPSVWDREKVHTHTHTHTHTH